MAIHVALNHVTHYQYDRMVNMSPHIVRLRPAPHTRTPIHAYSLKITPEAGKHFINWQQDPYSNYLARLVFPEPAKELRVEVDLVCEMTVINPFDFFVEASAEKSPFVYEPILRKELLPYFETSAPGPLLAALVKKLKRKDIRTIDYIVEINATLNRMLKYLIRLEPGVQTPEETLQTKLGSCRDFAWLQVHLLRHLGMAARFVSGYLIQLVADVKSLDGPSGTEVDFTDLHAWAEVYLPGAGWIGLDATSGLLTGEGHIPLACTAEPISAAPITGATDTCESVLKHTMSVRRVYEDPRVTKPYTDEEWLEIEALGHLVDRKLKAGDVRLTMGGEPTFISIDDMDGAEWNTAAMGLLKRKLGGQLFKRLRTRFAAGGFLHFGQGKWYPGESLPRWALGCYWRKDGQPIWQEPALIADDETDYGHGEKDAKRFITELAHRLGVAPEYALPGYEDAFYYLWKERRLPTNVDPFDSKLENQEDRARLAKVFEQGLEKVVGYALPLKPTGRSAARWASGSWRFRAERMYLLPGDSPMGFRLPLDSLAWVTKSDYPSVYERDPFEVVPALPEPRLARQRYIGKPTETSTPEGDREQKLDGPPTTLDRAALEGVGMAHPHAIGKIASGGYEEPTSGAAMGVGKSAILTLGKSAPNAIRTALCVETRKGKLHIFMPPMRYIEDYIDLVETIEETASKLKTPVVIEGYTPPHDPRINHLKVTPDPGVIEVNVQPVHTWDDAVKVTNGLYEDAYYSRLGTDKFMVDGRHSGTGGGNHIVVGGEVPQDSPFLRRPDLLKSLVAYWHNHPSLSYLFSGLFIGPTSQAPRADEGRSDNLYELEIAIQQVKPGIAPQPWLVDRLFRNLLIDLTGNTHRAEFCIDKMYSPDSSSGRLGLVEFRGFEMPPHPRMSLTQQLLLRSLIARFWEKPYDAPLVRWGTELHDRFLLPHFVSADFEDVLSGLNSAGFPLMKKWFAPHFEFRFPIHGYVDLAHIGGIHLELRQAIEPWNVLGEEPAGGGTARFVDSSVERLQVKVTGRVNPRHVLAVNGVAVPLHNTGRVGEFVAGVRYRAWQPPSCLHPTIPAHGPLVFDLVDTWNDKSVGGCTYNVAHPGGRSYDDFPINAFAAEARRVARFFKFGHTPGTIKVRTVTPSLEFPLTMDLRRS